MNKKMLVFVTVMVMLIASTAVAFAGPSVTAEAAPAVSGAVASDGTQISSEELTVTAVANVAELPEEKAEELQAAFEEVRTSASMSDFVASAGVETAVKEVLEKTGGDTKVEDLAVHSLFDVSATGNAAKVLAEQGSVTITFQVPTLKAGEVAVVLHQAESGWEVVPSTTGNGTVSATFTSLSPVMVLVESAAPVSGPVIAPQTSDISFEGILAAGAMICLAGLWISIKRTRA